MSSDGSGLNQGLRRFCYSFWKEHVCSGQHWTRFWNLPNLFDIGDKPSSGPGHTRKPAHWSFSKSVLKLSREGFLELMPLGTQAMLMWSLRLLQKTPDEYIAGLLVRLMLTSLLDSMVFMLYPVGACTISQYGISLMRTAVIVKKMEGQTYPNSGPLTR